MLLLVVVGRLLAPCKTLGPFCNKVARSRPPAALCFADPASLGMCSLHATYRMPQKRSYYIHMQAFMVVGTCLISTGDAVS